MNLAELRKDLVRHEGKRNFVYYDTVGVATIGIGRNLEHRGLSDNEVYYLFQNDIEQILTEVSFRYPFVFLLDDVRRDVVLNMVFNLGISRFSKFKKFLAAVENRDYVAAGEEMKNSRWFYQVGQRARELKYMMIYGERAH